MFKFFSDAPVDAGERSPANKSASGPQSDGQSGSEEEREALFMELSKSVKGVMRRIAEGKAVDDETENRTHIVSVISKVVSHGLASGKSCVDVLCKGMKATSLSLYADFQLRFEGMVTKTGAEDSEHACTTAVKFCLNSHMLSRTLEAIVKSFSCEDYLQSALLSHPESSEMVLGLITPLDDFDFNLSIEEPPHTIAQGSNPFLDGDDDGDSNCCMSNDNSTSGSTEGVVSKNNSELNVCTAKVSADDASVAEPSEICELKKEIERLNAVVEEQKQEIIELKRVNAANKEIKAQMSKMMEEQEKTVDALKRELESIKSQQKVLKNEPQKAKASPKKKEDFTAIKIVEREEPTNPFEDDVNETQSTNPFEGGSNIVINGNNSHINEEKKAQQKRANPFVTQHEKPKELHIKKKASARPVTMMPGNFKPLRSASDVSPKPTVSSAGDVSGADVRWVKKIVVCADSAVRYIEFDFSDGAVVSQGTLLKGAMTYYLKDGQHVNAIYGRRTQVLERVLIKFNTGEPFGPFGTHDGPDTFAYYAEDNESMQDVRMDKKKSFWSNDPCTVVPVWRRYK